MVNMGAALRGADPGDAADQAGSDGEPAGAWVRRLADLATIYGVDTFIVWLTALGRPQVDGFAREVFPGVRAEVDRRRESGR
jgi:hypothetical protein